MTKGGIPDSPVKCALYAIPYSNHTPVTDVVYDISSILKFKVTH